MKKPSKGHTATYRGRRVTLVLTNGERVTGKFDERRLNMDVVLWVDGKKQSFSRDRIHQFLCGNKTRD